MTEETNNLNFQKKLIFCCSTKFVAQHDSAYGKLVEIREKIILTKAFDVVAKSSVELKVLKVIDFKSAGSLICDQLQ